LNTQVVRVPTETHSRLKAMASARGETIGEVLVKAVESFRRQMLLNDANEAFGKLRQNEKLWKDEHHEREEWEATLADGLDNNE